MNQTELYCMNLVCSIRCQNWVKFCKVLNQVFHFAKELRCSAICVSGCVNCV